MSYQVERKGEAGSNNNVMNTESREVLYADDENQERGNWSKPVEFVLSCIGYCVGLGNVWRFPYLCYRNGGAVFLIPYVIMSALVGVPIFAMELSLGQFTSSGPLTCWKFSRLFSGLGWGMVIVTSLVAIYYNMILGWTIYYLIASFFELPNDLNGVPWTKCIKGKASDYCATFLQRFTAENCTGNFTALDNGVCVSANGSMNPLSGKAPFGIWNESLAKTHKIKEQVPTESYLYYNVLGRANVNDLAHIGVLKWELALCLLLAWIIVYFALMKGIKSSGKVVYFTALFPYAVLLALLIRGSLLAGASDGVKFYMSADLKKLGEPQVWKDAAVQVFFSLSASWGGLIALSSYNKFNNDVVRDTLIVCAGDSLTSLFSGFVIFTYLGFLSKEFGLPIADVVVPGTGLSFVVYTRAISSLPGAPAWAVLFFITLLCLGCDSQFSSIETILTALLDIMPKYRSKKWLVLLILCIVLYLLGLTLCTEGGSYMLDLLDTYSAGWNVMFISICECVAVAYVYGIRRFLKDIELMIRPTFSFRTWFLMKWWWIVCWCFVTPALVLFVMIFDWYGYSRMKYDDGRPFEDWLEALGWLCTLVVIVAIFVTPIYHFVKEKGTFRQRFLAIVKPTVDWGPALVKHRELVDYVDGWVIDPSSTTSYNNGNGNKYAQQYSNHAIIID